jgi:protein-disulfide isomerase
MKLLAVALTALLPAWAATAVDVERAKTIGSLSAPVRLELFSDFQCPGCKAFHDQVLPSLLKDYISAGKVYLVQKEFPLQGHQYSREAANLAVAAAHIGKYHAVADAIFYNQALWSLNGKVWDSAAKALTPAEQKQVLALSKDPAVTGQVQQELNTAQSLKIPETPTIFVVKGAKRYMFQGPNRDNYMLLRSLIDGLLK